MWTFQFQVTRSWIMITCSAGVPIMSPNNSGWRRPCHGPEDTPSKETLSVHDNTYSFRRGKLCFHQWPVFSSILASKLECLSRFLSSGQNSMHTSRVCPSSCHLRFLPSAEKYWEPWYLISFNIPGFGARLSDTGLFLTPKITEKSSCFFEKANVVTGLHNMTL